MDGRRCEGASWSLSLIIPAYNEEAGIRQAVEEADRALAGLAADYEVLVVDDGSRDETARIVAETAEKLGHVCLLRHRRNRGYGAALRTGFEAARFDRVSFTDADCQFHLADLASLVPLTDTHPLAVGYRVDRKDTRRRRFFSWGYNLLVRTLLDTRVRDCDCALKVFRQDALSALLPESPGFFVNTEMLTRARRLGYSVAEVGVRHRPRLHGASKVSWWDIPKALATLLPFWWSEVLFAAEGRARRAGRGARQPGASAPCATLRAALCHVLTLVFVAALLFFSRLDCPLQEPEEPRYAEIPRQMLERRDWVVPTLHGVPYYDKPPLLYWLIIGCYAVFGVHDWAARLVPSGAAFLCALLTYFWGRQTVGPRAAFAAASILCLSARFVYLGRLLTMNSLLCFFVVAALAAGHMAVRGPGLRWRWWLISAAACGLGLLTKGPVTLALVAVPVLAFQTLDRRAARPGLGAWVAYLAAALGLAAPWFAVLAARDPSFVDHFFWRHNLLRYVAPFDHAKPVWSYVPDLLLGMLPGSLLLLPLFKAFRRKPASESAPRPASLGFFLLASLWCFSFYSLAGSKRAGYILPAMPPFALALGCYLDVMLATTEKAIRSGLERVWSAFAFRLTSLVGITTFAVLFLALQFVLPGYAARFSLRSQVRPYAEIAEDPNVPVVCYPRPWDSVNFYLRRNDVRVYTAEQRGRLLTDLRANPRTLAFVKSDHSLDDVLRELPGSLEFVLRGRQAGVAVGWVRRRREVPATFFAGQ